jgi:DNA-binding SARP family transcriptional activator/predicted ATPase
MKEGSRMTLSLHLFGAPVLHDNGTPTPLSRRKAMALLSYLAVTRSRHHRETLAALLWPESDATAAYSALRNVLWILRQTPLSDSLHSDRSTVELVDINQLEVDVNRFRVLTLGCPTQAHGLNEVCATCEPQLKEAVGLWRDSFMRGFTVANSIQFEDWQFAEGEALRRELTGTLDRMIDYYAMIEDWASAARFARQWLHVDALNELGFRKLMDALAHQGKRGEALQAFAECTNVLMSELGLSPEASTVELAESIRASKTSGSASRTSRSHRLPSALNPIIGRRDMADRLEKLLKDESSQIVTLVGLGGSGKTSLALHVGRRIEDHFEHGAVFVPLDSEGRDSVAASTIAQALGIAHPRDDHSALIEQLADHLRDRSLLLILDGAEWVLPQIVALLPKLEVAQHVRILLTSRIALGTGNEIAMPLHGLAYPAIDIPPEKATEYAAVRLLRISAQRQGNLPETIDAELAGMARLARLLEGSPLGLEMAAGWRSVLTWDEIADRVSDKLEFLVQLREVVAPRHRAFAAVFEGAWGMLSDEGQAALRRLSVFRGSFTIKAAEYVAEVPPSVLALLVNRCLIKRVGPKRYEIHELLRQFASRKLTSTERKTDRVRVRHAEHYLQSVATWFQALKGPDQYLTLQRMRDDLANVRLAFQHAADIGASDLLRGSSEGVFFYYDMCTQFEEAETVFVNAGTAYGQCEDQEGEVDAFLRIAAGWFAHHIRPDRAAERFTAGIKLLGDTYPVTRLHAMSNVICAYASSGSDVENHAKRVQASVDFYRAQQDLWGEGLATAAWASVESDRDEAKAESLAYESLRLHREAGDAWGEGLVLLSLAFMAEARGNFELALTRYEESQRLSQPIAADITGVIEAISGQARVTCRLGNAEKSEVLAKQAVRLSQGIGNRLQMARARIELARARRMLGDPASAKELLESAFAMLTHRQWSHLQASCAVSLVNLAVEVSDIGSADRWHREASLLEPEHPALASLAKQLEKLRKDSKP